MFSNKQNGPIMKKVILYSVSIFMLIPFFSVAQTTMITGKVYDSKTGDPLVGANIVLLNDVKGTLTDLSGNYSISATNKSTLVISYLGYVTQTYQLQGETSHNFSLVAEQTNLDQVIVVGSRRPGRILIESTSPVDIVNIKQQTGSTARMDLTSILNYAAPSMNYNKQSGSDGSDHIELATLRGLGPDQSLVMINGKRRHQTALVSVFGTRGRGNSGTDLNAFPAAAIDRVEILRDGASAQYGSDAIAGVINLILKKNTGEFSFNAGYSGYYDKKFNPYFKKELNQYVYEKALDGQTFAADVNYGFGLGKEGSFVNLTLQYLDGGKTYRQSLDQNFDAEYGLPVNIYRRAHGDGSLTSIGGFLNAEYPLSEKLKIYSFGGYNLKDADSYAFTRNFSARPDRFVTDSMDQIIIVKDIIRNSDSTATANADQYYNPHIQTKIKDFSAAVGIKREFKSGWNWDLSNVSGQNDFHFYGDQTFNASLGNPNKNHFDDGGFSFFQNTSNFNVSKEISGILHGMNLAAGAEYRMEQYKLYAGEEASYKNYNDAKATGSQGFPGYQPNDAVNSSRSATAIYTDLEFDVTKAWLVNTAIRLENYSDFGFTHNYKIASIYKTNQNFNIRGSLSTGFRAPSLQQINFSSTFTTVQGGTISEVKIAPNDNIITKAAGIPKLKEEKSINANIGYSWRLNNNLNISYDFYWVKIKDRVVLSGQFDASDNTLDTALTNALKDLNVGLAQFFANAVNTTNRGIDIVIDYNKKCGSSRYRLLTTANFQRMSINKINVPNKLNDTESHQKQFLSDREQAFILASAPPIKMGINLEYGYKKLNVGTRLSYFGKTKILGYGQDGLGINPTIPTDDESRNVADSYLYNGKWVTDIYLSYSITKNINLNLGADNLFNIHPDLGAVSGAKWWAFNNETGGPWDAVQMGGNGLRLFGKLGLTF